MPDYRRANVPGGTYFFTVNTYRRQMFLTGADVRTALRYLRRANGRGHACWVGRAVRALTDRDISARRKVARGRALRLLD